MIYIPRDARPHTIYRHIGSRHVRDAQMQADRRRHHTCRHLTFTYTPGSTDANNQYTGIHLVYAIQPCTHAAGPHCPPCVCPQCIYQHAIQPHTIHILQHIDARPRQQRADNGVPAHLHADSLSSCCIGGRWISRRLLYVFCACIIAGCMSDCMYVCLAGNVCMHACRLHAFVYVCMYVYSNGCYSL